MSGVAGHDPLHNYGNLLTSVILFNVCHIDMHTPELIEVLKIVPGPLQVDKMPEREEDEAKGVEMEGDFEGDLVDLPSDAEEDDEEGEQNEDEEQRLDQEMGDVGEQGQVPFSLSSCRCHVSLLSNHQACLLLQVSLWLVV